MKSINKTYLSEESSKQKVMQEVYILKRTRHRNVVRLYETFETNKHILFVIEMCSGGDLLNYVRKRRRLKEDVAKYLFKQLIEGLQYCHSKNIVHRDIKLDNVLVTERGEVKVGLRAPYQPPDMRLRREQAHKGGRADDGPVRHACVHCARDPEGQGLRRLRRGHLELRR